VRNLYEAIEGVLSVDIVPPGNGKQRIIEIALGVEYEDGTEVSICFTEACAWPTYIRTRANFCEQFRLTVTGPAGHDAGRRVDHSCC
jgi:hypothetical protein